MRFSVESVFIVFMICGIIWFVCMVIFFIILIVVWAKGWSLKEILWDEKERAPEVEEVLEEVWRFEQGLLKDLEEITTPKKTVVNTSIPTQPKKTLKPPKKRPTISSNPTTARPVIRSHPPDRKYNSRRGSTDE